MLFVLPLLGGCRDEALKKSDQPDGGIPGGLTAVQAAQVIATVGDKQITLGEFAATLERMDQFDRLRYQTPERRRELLDHMIKAELLADEARRRGLDKKPEVQAATRQILRDSLLDRVRKTARAPGDIPEAEVKEYYEDHKSDYTEPERRRVAHIVVKSEADAKRVLAKALEASNAQWGELVAENTTDPVEKQRKGPIEMAGDLGLVGPPDDPRGANPRVNDAVRAAAYEIAKVGRVLEHVVKDSAGDWHVVRLIGQTAAHERSFDEAQRNIRIAISQKEMAEKEASLESMLRTRFPVTIDDKSLSAVTVPKPQASAKPEVRPVPED